MKGENRFRTWHEKKSTHKSTGDERKGKRLRQLYLLKRGKTEKGGKGGRLCLAVGPFLSLKKGEGGAYPGNTCGSRKERKREKTGQADPRREGFPTPIKEGKANGRDVCH